MTSTEKHACRTCGEVTGSDGHMCVPANHEDEKCAWCGALIVNKRHLCADKVQELAYVCNSCGRTAVQAEHLCDPVPIS